MPAVWVPGSSHTVKAPGHLPAAGAAATAWSNFVKAAVARYGPNGSFWAENPAVPKRPIRTWQIWNEPNFKYFVAKPNPAEYGKLVKLSYTRSKSADPGAKLVLGGMFSRPKGGKSTKEKPKRVYFASDFLEQMYKTTPGIKAKFNGIALHPYTGKYQELTPEIEEVRGCPEGEQRRRQGPLDHRARLELAAAAGQSASRTSSPKAPPARRPSSKAPSRC